jgi:hemerythrin
MTKTTIDIKNLEEIKIQAIKRKMTLKQLLNKAVKEYLKTHPVKSGRQSSDG